MQTGQTKRGKQETHQHRLIGQGQVQRHEANPALLTLQSAKQLTFERRRVGNADFVANAHGATLADVLVGCGRRAETDGVTRIEQHDTSTAKAPVDVSVTVAVLSCKPETNGDDNEDNVSSLLLGSS